MSNEDDWGESEDVKSKEVTDWDKAVPVVSKETSIPLISYSVLNNTEIEKKVTTTIQDCVDLCVISSDEATIILMYYKWNWDKLQADWFNKEKEIREKCGIPSIKSKEKPNEQCPICFEDLDLKNADLLKCNHAFCTLCWKGHLKAALSNGKACLLARCPFPKCNLRVGSSFFKKYLTSEDYGKYQKFLIASYTEDNKKIKCCPNAGCENIIENNGPYSTEVTCKCDFVFCFNCHAEGHTPTTCEINKKWEEKNTSESENVTWIKANTKPCPSCKKCIEKNQGCNHMTCSQCHYEFCWICMGDWKAHNGNYNCNKVNKKLWNVQQTAKSELERYMFYFERFENHKKAIKKAEEQRECFRDFSALLNKIKGLAFIDCNFLFDGIKTVKNIRRILANSYAFGYFLTSIKEVQLFEFIQKDLELHTELLHEMLERPKDLFLDPEDLTNFEFFKYKSEVSNACTVLTKFCQNFISGITNGFTTGKKF